MCLLRLVYITNGLTQGSSEEELFAITEEDIPHAAGEVQVHSLGEHSVYPVQQVEIWCERGACEVGVKLGQILPIQNNDLITKILLREPVNQMV